MVGTLEAKSNVSNDAESSFSKPFTVAVAIEGTADLLFHRWSDDAVEAKSKAAKGSTAKKTDDVESYVYRNAENHICIPGRYLQRAIVEAARFHQDPRSPRKMAKDLVQAAVVVTTPLAPVLVGGKPTDQWDYLDRQRVVIQRSAITRVRPAFTAGWRAEFEVTVLLSDYVSPAFLHRLVEDGGRFVGLADFRPTYGRYHMVNWEIIASE